MIFIAIEESCTFFISDSSFEGFSFSQVFIGIHIDNVNSNKGMNHIRIEYKCPCFKDLNLECSLLFLVFILGFVGEEFWGSVHDLDGSQTLAASTQ